MGEEILRDFIHQHPLSQIANPNDYLDNWCCGCWRYFLPGETAYGCSSNCGFNLLLHKECLEMPREIRHHVHPSHPLTLQNPSYSIIGNTKCAVCEWGDSMYLMRYICSGGCESWWIHLGCAVGLVDEDEKHPPINHPSHPQHPLRFSNKTTSCSFPCNACGTTTEKGNSYICAICDYWIHESCALLPVSASYPRHHPDHPLSLAYYPPYDYIRYGIECAMCRGALRLRNWVYHCQLCRYVVHIKCATDTSLVPTSNSFDNENEVDDHKDIIECPMNDIYEEIIRPFVKKERERGGEIFLPHDDNVNGKYKFDQHHHLLSFTMFSTSSSSSASSHDHNEDEDDDDDDDLDSIQRSEITCDGCTLPILQNEYDNGYMSCDECKYFLHLACFNLPSELPSLPLHSIKDHNLTLQNAGKLEDWEECDICYLYTNGLFYSCTKCSFKSNIKCASLPSTIKHAAHPHHLLELVTNQGAKYSYFCALCYYTSRKNKYYRCDRCNFCVCGRCVMLPARNKHRLEKHWMPLTYKVYVNRPGDFYCSSCEDKMYPKRCMYYCRECDQSFHPDCFPATSGEYRNINFGRQQYVFGRQQYVIPTIHHPHHPLRFQIITKKKRCDLCHQDRYDKPGFQCVSCNFVMCLDPCTISHMDALKPYD